MGRFTAAVRGYLAVCQDNAGVLSRKYHPTEQGALMVVFHRSAEEAAEIRKTFREERRRRPGKGS